MKRIGLIVAMPEETEHLLIRLGKEKRKHSILGYGITEYKVMSKKIYLINSGVGEINAAGAAAVLIMNFSVEAIINFGLAGALKGGIKVGDILIGKDVVHYDFDISAFFSLLKGGYPDSEQPAMPADGRLISLAESITKDIKRVRIASGDKFVSSTELKNQLIEEFDADICEMESAGIIRIADKAGVPVLFIKTVSDEADEGAVDAIAGTIENGVTAYIKLIEELLIII